jgi:threonine/homoserine efflux transporter RhtA
VTLPPVVSILLAVFSVQGGAVIAKGLFPVIGAAGATGIRIGLSALILPAVFRPPVHRFTAAQWRAVVPYGISIGVMNLLFYRYAAGVALAILSSALPFTLEMNALRALPGRTFSILMSLEPAVAALCGLVLLGEHLTKAQWAAVGMLIAAASVGATMTARQAPAHVDV